jgi:hypothetical protein
MTTSTILTILYCALIIGCAIGAKYNHDLAAKHLEIYNYEAHDKAANTALFLIACVIGFTLLFMWYSYATYK